MTPWRIALAASLFLGCGSDPSGAETDTDGQTGADTEAGAEAGSMGEAGGTTDPPPPPPPLMASCEAPEPPTLGAPTEVATADELRAAVAAGGEVLLTADIDADAPFPSTEAVVIDGAGHTINGGGSTHLFVAEDADLTIMNMTLRDAVNRVADAEHFSRRSGAAVMMRGNGQGRLSVFGVTFENNTIGDTGPGDLRGGALYAFAVPEVVIVDSEFTGNAGSNGGAIGGLGSSFTIVNTAFLGNETTGQAGSGSLEGRGGAISLDALSQNGQTAYLEVCGSFFESNRAKHAGGAIALVTHQWQGATVIVDQTTFRGNSTNDTSGGSGGAIYLLDDENYPRERDANAALISNSTFEGNETLGGGGGLWFLTESGRLELHNNTFFENRTTSSMGMGGAVALVGGPTDVTHCTFADNHAQFHGGGIQAAQNAQVLVTNSLFANNTSDRDGGWAWFHSNRELDDGGGNIQWLDSGLEIDDNSNKLVSAGTSIADPQLLSLQDNGGATHTQALPEGSPAVDAGVDAALPLDQRGEPRNGAPDVGAYEVQ